jgi:hypothetical protein
VSLRSIPLLSIAVLALAAPVADAAPRAEKSGGLAFLAADATPDATPDVAPQVESPKALLIDGVAHAPAGAPEAVKRAIAAGNALQDKPYRYGGGHGRIEDSGYDCSGTVSYALAKAGLLKTPLDSGSFMSWGRRGKGDWITIRTNPGHAYVVIAGLRLDTSAANDPGGEKGPRWRPALRNPSGFTARHPAGL